MFCVSFTGMGLYPAVVFFLLFSASLSSSGDCGKVLVYPVDGSHWPNMKILLEALHSQGHQITVLCSSTSWYVSEFSPYYTSITIPQEQPQNLESQAVMTSFLKRSMEICQNQGSVWAFFEFYRTIFNLFGENQQDVAKLVVCIFENKTLIRELNETGYDLSYRPCLSRWSACDTLSQASLDFQCTLDFQWRGTFCHCSFSTVLHPCGILILL